MKAYAIFPAFELDDPANARVQDCISLITRMVCERLREGRDSVHHAIDWSGDITDPAVPAIVRLDDPGALHDVVRHSVDPWSAEGTGTIRSMISCRAVTFGYDGQAFLCLRHEDAAPVSPDPSLVIVEERPEFLYEWDIFG